MLNAWPVIGSGVHWNAPAWSISVEWFCYLFLFPLLLRLGAPRSTPIRLLCIVLLSSASYSMFVRHFDGELSAAQLHQSADKLSYWVDLIRGAFGFTAGWIVFLCYERRDALYTFCTKSPSLIWSVIAIIIAVAYCGRINLQALVFVYPFAILAATDRASIASRLLGSRPLHFLGVISYSIYMTHFILFIGLMVLFGSPDIWRWFAYPAAILISFAVFWFSYFLIERPAREAIRHIQTTSTSIVSAPP
ncbi:peptidoglycan/LPS O-acetylase OafA/YrhL [Bradyrhizobium sp. USDA 4509]